MRNIAIIETVHEQETGRRIRKILSFAGAEPRELLTLTALETERAVETLTDRVGGLVASWSALRELYTKPGKASSLIASLQRFRCNIILHGFDGSEDEARFLSQLTRGQIMATSSFTPTAGAMLVFGDSRMVWGPLAKAHVRFATSETVSAFATSPQSDSVEHLIQSCGKTLMASCANGLREVWLVGNRVPDLDRPVSGETFDTLIDFSPWLAGARWLLKDRAWSNPHPQGCLIIDDPLLKERYGCLRYRTLLENASKVRFSACIAFIPWNYRRTRRSVSELFLQHPEIFSICVHGCDHTNGEFLELDLARVTWLSVEAWNRMARHECFYGLPFDKTMVFPQGLFSTAALHGLRVAGYLAAINTSPFPCDLPEGGLKARQLLEPAVTEFSNFPLFGRRYPTHPGQSAFDLFLGKPAFLVEHHRYFSDGGRRLVEFISRLNAFEPRLHWTNPATICSQVSLRRKSANGETQVKFYCDRFRLQNETATRQSYVLFRKRFPNETVAGITANAQPTEYELFAGHIRIPLSLEAGAETDLRVIRPAPDRVAPARPRPGFSTKVFFRRHLSELRDNYVHTSPMLLRMNARLRNFRAQPRGPA